MEDTENFDPTSLFGDPDKEPTEKPKSNHFQIPVPKEKTGKTSITLGIVPPFGELKDTGHWRRYIPMHFGYNGVDSRDPNKLRARPFVCPDQNKRKDDPVRCAECLKNQSKREEVERLEVMQKQDPTPEREMAIEQLKAYTKAHNLSRKHYFLVHTEDMQWGNMKVSTKTKNALLQCLDELKAKGETPLSWDNGLYITFTRVGRQQEAVESVTVAKDSKEIPGIKGKVDIDKARVLTPSQILEGSRALTDLTKLGRKVTHEQVESLVESADDPEIVDAILGINHEFKAVG